jgi:hypothetical protein
MAQTIRRVEYYYASVRDDLGAAYRTLEQLADLGVNLLAFTAVLSGPNLAQFALFPEDPNKLIAEARAAQLPLDGPHRALLVQGDDELGALASASSAPASTSTRPQASPMAAELSAMSYTCAKSTSSERPQRSTCSTPSDHVA